MSRREDVLWVYITVAAALLVVVLLRHRAQ
jgi:preprotein translocase subunit SecG